MNAPSLDAVPSRQPSCRSATLRGRTTLETTPGRSGLFAAGIDQVRDVIDQVRDVIDQVRDVIDLPSVHPDQCAELIDQRAEVIDPRADGTDSRTVHSLCKKSEKRSARRRERLPRRTDRSARRRDRLPRRTDRSVRRTDRDGRRVERRRRAVDRVFYAPRTSQSFSNPSWARTRRALSFPAGPSSPVRRSCPRSMRPGAPRSAGRRRHRCGSARSAARGPRVGRGSAPNRAEEELHAAVGQDELVAIQPEAPRLLLADEAHVRRSEPPREDDGALQSLLLLDAREHLGGDPVRSEELRDREADLDPALERPPLRGRSSFAPVRLNESAWGARRKPRQTTQSVRGSLNPPSRYPDSVAE